MSLDVNLVRPTCGCCGHSPEGFWANITHNLSPMAKEAGIREALWAPDENGFETAGQIIEILEAGINKMKADPEHFKKFDASNGWGTYKHFIPWLDEYLAACKRMPDAVISVSR